MADSGLEGAAEEGEYLDLCAMQLPDLSEKTLGPGITGVDLSQNRLKALDPKLLALPKLRTLSMRQNLVTDASGLRSLAKPEVMEDLSLNDNQLEEFLTAEDLEKFTGMKSMDVSFNQLRSIGFAAGLIAAQPRDLYFANNKIPKVEGLSHLTSLRSLELGSNRLRSLEGIETLVNLEELYIGRNKLTALEHMEGLTKLKILSAQSNRIVEIKGLETCVALEELYLSHNGVTRMAGLDTLVELNTLDIAANRLTKIEGLDKLTKLEHLWLNDNQVGTLEGLEEALQPVKDTLNTLYLERNPGAADAEAYKQAVLRAVPTLYQLDALPVKR
mmetsp:Transcript_14181/g.30331  ORF Transcript_14181/g.30331 Transcript_14181/m.30331 type:complete len:330 (-) Transcript_14181:233-1222(-)|eukprot:CAMPEP_0118942190 /NCGR_PEP_ID=MMETSP1169-20130426/35655_1 /TAXON_ID=36882 /ORGANISM="Pyramimonas obovata, Strain CCMP722" /LENGTH=329 /DNA_ID=CAMNT_0006887167 /DNA_START=98 /DNA_END=1087 /DNA_ORIENTATION=-